MTNIAFIESTIGIPLSNADRSYLNEKTDFYTAHKGTTGTLNFLGRQLGHIALLPYKLVCLTVQTVTDLFILVMNTVLAPVLILFGRLSVKDAEKEIACRSYNLLVADVFAFCSVIPSIVNASFFNEATTYHLGTLRGNLY